MVSQIIQRALEAGFDQAGILPIETVKFDPRLYVYCEQNLCGAHMKNWACPSHAGAAEQWNAIVPKYNGAVVVQTSGTFDDGDSMKAYNTLFPEHHKKFRCLIEDVRKMGFEEIQPFSAEYCTYCKSCTCPDEPCRFPDMCFPAMEGAGLYVKDLCDAAGLPFGNFGDFVTFVSLILVKE